MKAVARVPPSLRGCASFSPDMGFVQPSSFFEFGLRFRPDPASLARCAQDGWGVVSASPPTPLISSSSAIPSSSSSSSGGGKFPTSSPDTSAAEGGASTGGGREDGLPGRQRKPGKLGYEGENSGDALAVAGEEEAQEAPRTAGAGGMIAVPMRFDVPGQVLPARSVLQARLTGWSVEVDCGDAEHEAEAAAGRTGRNGATVKFGRCFVGQSVSRRVSLRNTSLLPVKFGFVGGPAEVR